MKSAPSINKARTDYHPFGMVMPSRSWEAASADGYRFGFNTQEPDNEVYGHGNLNTAEFWEYDTRLGRRWNTDPVNTHSISLFACFANNPIFFKDIFGDDGVAAIDSEAGTITVDVKFYYDKTDENTKQLLSNSQVY